jgi:hypothetical protein
VPKTRHSPLDDVQKPLAPTMEARKTDWRRLHPCALHIGTSLECDMQLKINVMEDGLELQEV